MRWTPMLLLTLLVGCASADTDVAVVTPDDTAVDDGVNDVDPADLQGKPPAVAVAAPEFVALNYDNTPRSREDLLGHPTVIWFYPAASSGL